MSKKLSETRPKIPASIQRQVLIESGHRCAIPTCRHMSDLHIHHIVPWHECKEHKEENLIPLCPNCHAAAHSGKIDKQSLRTYKANLQKINDVYTRFEIDVLFECGKNCEAYLSVHLLLLIKRLLDSNLVHCSYGSVITNMGGIDTSPCRIRLTPKGEEYYKALVAAHSINEEFYSPAS